MCQQIPFESLELGPDPGGPGPPDSSRRSQLLRLRDVVVRPEAASGRPGSTVAKISPRVGVGVGEVIEKRADGCNERRWYNHASIL